MPLRILLSRMQPGTHVRARLVFAVFGLAVLMLALAPIPSLAQSTAPSNLPVSFKAETLTHDREAGTIVATGNVEASQKDRILLADRMVYDQAADTLAATGNVSLTEPSGEVFFATSMKLSGDMKNGIVQDLRALLADNSRMAAQSAERSNATVTTMNRAVYSPCDLCPEDPSRPPLWQLKAVKVIHDKDRQIIEYKDAWMEFAGVPVLYTPYFYHPDPSVKRKSGFLTPSIQTSTDLGAVVKTPYYWNIAPNRASTLTPIFTGKAGTGLVAEYDELMRKGEINITGSIISDEDKTNTTTTDDNSGTRWHISTEGEAHLDRTWRAGLKFNRVSDDTYLRRYDLGNESIMRSRLYTEGFRGRNYMHASAYDFQDLRTDSDASDTPLILPLLEFNHKSEAGRYGQTRTLDASFVTLARDEGTDVNRLSAKAGWQMPFLRPTGDIITLSASLRGDAYHVKDNSTTNTAEDGSSGRIIPQAALHWRYPFVKNQKSTYQLIEPAASFIVSPYGGNPSDIPNEDSVSVEFDDTNLFNENRFAGLDQVEGGPRINYGLRWGVYGQSGGSTTLMVGQSFRVNDDDTFSAGTGLEDHFSDIVGRLHIAPAGTSNLNFYYRTQINKDDLSARRHELQGSVGPSILNLSLDYSFFEDPPDSEYNGREQISATLSSQFTNEWRGYTSIMRDLTDDGGLRSLGLGLTYEDECFIFAASATRSFFTDRDLKPSDSISLTLTFKTLGDVSSGPQTIDRNKAAN